MGRLTSNRRLRTLLPLISKRLLDPALQRSDSGSIGPVVHSACFSQPKRAPQLTAEVGTYIGNSAAAKGFGAGLNGQAVKLITCDMHPCTKNLCGLQLSEGSEVKVLQGSSTQMFKSPFQGAKLDMLHLDGRLPKEDLQLLSKLLKTDTVIALDDCEGDEKGHKNLDLLRRSD